MKIIQSLTKLLLLMVFFIHSFGVNAQLLLVGSSVPNEVVNIIGGSVQYDSIIVINSGKLYMSQADVQVFKLIAVLDSGQVFVNGCNFEANGTVYGEANGRINLKDSVRLKANIFMTGKSMLKVDSAAMDIPMSYKDEYNWYGFDSASVVLANCVGDFNNGALGGVFRDSASFIQNNVFYSSSLGVTMTLDFNGQAKVSVNNGFGGMEFIVSDEVSMSIDSSSFFMMWYRFGEDDSLAYQFPAPNSSFPMASDLTNYHFIGGQPGLEGVGFDVNITETQRVYWGILSDPLSKIEINNSVLVATGFIFDNNQMENIEAFKNDSIYASFSAPFTDRQFELNQASVLAWNFYSFDSAFLTIRSSLFGEILGFENGKITVRESECDGTGGFFGGRQKSIINVYNSRIYRKFGSAPIINTSDDAIIRLFHSSIDGNIISSKKAQLYLANSSTTQVPQVLQQSFFLETTLDTLGIVYTDSSYQFGGSVSSISGSGSSQIIDRFIVSYSESDSTNFQLVMDSSGMFNGSTNFQATWNTNGLLPDEYWMWLTVFIDGDTAISFATPVTVSYPLSQFELAIVDGLSVFPNPANEIVTVDSKLFGGKYAIYSISGNRILEGDLTQGITTINIGKMNPGIYLLNATLDNGEIFRNKIIVK